MRRNATDFGILISGLIAIIMLAVAIFGQPPYSFYSILKVVVVISAGACAWAVFKVSRIYLPLAILLVALGFTELTGRMRKEQWVSINVVTLVLFVFALIVLVVAMKRPPKLEESPPEVS